MPGVAGSWRAEVRHERGQLGLTQVALGRAVGLSAETIRKYEAGTRTPTRDHLVSLLRALQIPHIQAREILAAAGFNAADTLFPTDSFRGYYSTLEEAAAAIEGTPWPQFVVNDVQELVAANHTARLLWDIDLPAELASRDRARLHLLALMAEPPFMGRLANLEECLGVAVAVLKGMPSGPASDDGDPWVEHVLARFAASNPSVLATLLHVWDQTPAQVPKSRWTYRVVWREAEGDIAFHCVVSTASETDGLSFNDWTPADAASHKVMESVIEARAASGGKGSRTPRTASRRLTGGRASSTSGR